VFGFERNGCSAWAGIRSWRLVAAGIPLQGSLADDWSWVALSFFIGLSFGTSVYWPWRRKEWYPAWWGSFLWTAAIVLAVGVPLVWALRIPDPSSRQLTAYAGSALLTLPILMVAVLGLLHEARTAGTRTV
jgi:hypothetical protein